MAKNMTPETSAFRKTLSKLEERICNSILGGVRLLEHRKYPRITQEANEYFGIGLDEEITVLRFKDVVPIPHGNDTIVGVALQGTGVGLIKGDNYTDDIDIYYTGDLDVDLTELLLALEVVETLVNKVRPKD